MGARNLGCKKAREVRRQLPEPPQEYRDFSRRLLVALGVRYGNAMQICLLRADYIGCLGQSLAEQFPRRRIIAILHDRCTQMHLGFVNNTGFQIGIAKGKT